MSYRSTLGEEADSAAVVDCRQNREGLKQFERPPGVLR